MTADMNTPNHHHLQVWRETGVMSSDRYLIVNENYRSAINPTTYEMEYQGNAILLVKNKEALDEFNDWWAKYSSRFNGLESEIYLPEPGNNFISGYLVPHTIPTGPVIQISPPRSFKDEWVFIITNCPNKVYWTITHWIFTDQNDAVIFKLKQEIP